MKILKRIMILVIAAVILCLLVIVFRLRFPSDPLKYCQVLIICSADQWQLETNVYPNVEGNGQKSFAMLIDVRKSGERMAQDYGYVPGLKADDPKDLVFMYFKKKTRRTWNGDYTPSIYTEPKWMVIGPEVVGSDTCPEGGRLETTAEFKRRLQKTLDFLRENNRPYWENVVKEHTAFLNSIQE